MITLLAKLFIKNHKNYCDSKVRLAYGTLCAFVGIFFNILLFASKFIAGLVSKSVAITADAFNNLSDAASSIIQLFGFKLSSKEPDQSHPFGHGRFEYISGLIISFLILLMGFELLKSSVLSLFNPPELSSGIFSIAVMLAAIAVKCYMYFYNHITAKKINSVALEAVAKDSLSDCISTFTVIIATIAGKFVSFPVDGLAGD
ncbi:cation diffusion facilitator family transporter, partial [Treponema berlinense]|uniref:cation diffusion facilitator family transporter n=1 Tax=Treponema berlinense TaxID=225004 RepID=UPI0023569B11